MNYDSAGFIDKEAGANSERRCDGGAVVYI